MTLGEDRLHRFVGSGVTAEDIAEGLVSFDSDREARPVREQLRNRLAHAQDIVTSSLETIVSLAHRLDTVLDLYGRS